VALNHAEAGEVVDLRPLGTALRQAKTAAIVKSDRFEAVRLVLPAETDIPVHKVEGYITLQCLEGRVTIETTKAIALEQGEWLYLDRGAPHAVHAHEDSSVLLTIFFDR
jgi:quercetin dioxygenase-like cupin family protein